LVQVACALATLQGDIASAAKIHGIPITDLDTHNPRVVKRVLSEKAGKDKSIVTAPLPGGRMPHNSVKNVILGYAEQVGGEFTVDDLQKDVPFLAGCRRRSIVTNLHAMSSRGARPLRQTGPGTIGRKGKPATYTLRKDNKGA
jgi:hypothetical protein